MKTSPPTLPIFLDKKLMNSANNTFGQFTEDGMEYVVKTPQTPRDWFNMFWNPTYLACAGQNMNGFSLY